MDTPQTNGTEDLGDLDSLIFADCEYQVSQR